MFVSVKYFLHLKFAFSKFRAFVSFSSFDGEVTAKVPIGGQYSSHIYGEL